MALTSSPFDPQPATTAPAPSIIRALLIPADEAKPLSEGAVACDYPALPRVIGARYFEPLRLADYPDLILILDEEGFLNGRAPNRRASKLAGCHLVGDALVVRDGEEDYLDLAPEDLTLLHSLI